MHYIGYIEVCTQSGTTLYSSTPCETKEEALMELGAKSMQFASFDIIGCYITEIDNGKSKIVYTHGYNHVNNKLTFDFHKKHAEEAERISKVIRASYMELKRKHSIIDDYLYSGSSLPEDI